MHQASNPELVAAVMLGGILTGVMIGYPLGLLIGSLGFAVGCVLWGINLTMELYYIRIYDILLGYTLLAVPLFVFMGNMMEQSGITERLYDALYLWLGGVRGGLAILTMIIGAIVGACIGVASASVTMLAIVGLPAMIPRGYSKSLAAGTVTAGGCLGILIPPSVMFIIYGPMAELSVGKMFFGAVIPGFMLAFLYILYIGIRCSLQPAVGPAIPPEERANVPLGQKTWMLVTALVPPSILVLAVLGVIFFGIAAPTEAAAVGAAAATLLVIANRKFNFNMLKKCALDTLNTCGFVFLVVVMGFAYTGVFIGSGAGNIFAKAIMAVPGGTWGAFLVIMFLFFILGFILDWIPIIFILVPVATIVAKTVGFDPLWFAMMVCINFQTSFITPPFCMAVFITYGVAPKELGLTLQDCIRGIWPFVFLIIIELAMCVAFPKIITWLPSQMIR
jgi:tripartite ATP-independent transporter DctM subunit